jgi:cytochrome c oxidase subunit 2
MFLRKSGVGVAMAALVASVATFGGALPAAALPVNYEMGFQAAASPVMEQIEDFHRLLVWIIVAVCLFVLALLAWIVVKYRAGANANPSKVHHNTLLEVAWTLIPVIILVFIAVPSFRLLYFEAAIPKPDVQIKAIGKQWFWTYEYPGTPAGFTFDSLGLSDADAAKAGKPRLLGVDNAIYVPVNKVVEVETTGADVIHSWAMPQMGVKMDAVPGRLNHTWFKANQTGVYYGQCSELCGARHAYMPIELHVVSDAEYAAWLAGAKKKFAALDTGATRVASK